jgi:hypothetical protein
MCLGTYILYVITGEREKGPKILSVLSVFLYMNFVRHKERETEREARVYCRCCVCLCIFFCALSEREGGRASHPKTVIVKVGLSGVRRQRA